MSVLQTTVQTGDNCAWVLTYTFDVVDECGNTLSNQEIVYLGSDLTPPVFTNCPADITLDSPSDLTLAPSATATDCDGQEITIIPDPLNVDSTKFYEEYFGLLDEPGFCPDSVYRYYIARDDCGREDTCVQRVIILPQDCLLYTSDAADE